MPSEKDKTQLSHQILNDHNTPPEIRAVIHEQMQALLDLRKLLAEADLKRVKLEQRVQKLEFTIRERDETIARQKEDIQSLQEALDKAQHNQPKANKRVEELRTKCARKEDAIKTLLTIIDHYAEHFLKEAEVLEREAGIVRERLAGNKPNGKQKEELPF